MTVQPTGGPKPAYVDPNTGSPVYGEYNPSTTAPSNQPVDPFKGLEALTSMVQVLQDLDPKLKEAYQAYLNKDSALMQSLILSSNFYRNNGALARQRIQAQEEQPDAYKKEVKTYVLAARKRLVQRGVKLDDNINAQIEFAYLNGQGDDELDETIIKSNTLVLGGQTRNSVDNLKAFADSYGVGKFFNDSYWTQTTNNLFSGTIASEDIQKEIQTMSAGAYPAFAEGIMNGKSLDMQAGYIKTTVASTLGVDANSLSWDDLNVKKFTQYMDPTTKKPTLPPQWQVETETKKANYDQWSKTPDGTNTINSLSMTVLRDMGMMA